MVWDIFSNYYQPNREYDWVFSITQFKKESFSTNPAPSPPAYDDCGASVTGDTKICQVRRSTLKNILQKVNPKVFQQRIKKAINFSKVNVISKFREIKTVNFQFAAIVVLLRSTFHKKDKVPSSIYTAERSFKKFRLDVSNGRFEDWQIWPYKPLPQDNGCLHKRYWASSLQVPWGN